MYIARHVTSDPWHMTCWDWVQVPRRAMQVLALFLEAGRFGLLLPLLSEEAGSPSLVQRLVMLVDSVTRSTQGAAAWLT